MGLAAQLGSEEFPIDPKHVEALLASDTKRGGVRGLATKILQAPTLFIPDPGEGGAHGVPEAPPPDWRCVEVTPGFCPASHESPERVVMLAQYLHTFNFLYGEDLMDPTLEPLLCITPILDLDVAGPLLPAHEASGFWLCAGARKSMPTATWIRCAARAVGQIQNVGR